MDINQFLVFSKRFKESLILLRDDGLILSFNPVTSRLFGIPRENLHQQFLSNVVIDSKEKVQRYLMLWKSTGEFLPATFSIKNSEGNEIEFTVEGCLLQPRDNKNPALLMLRCNLKNVSTQRFLVLNEKIQQLTKEIHERAEIEKGLRESEEKVRLLLHSTAEAIYGIDHFGCCTFANSTFLSLLGFESEQDVIGKNMHQLIHHSSADGRRITERISPIYHAYKYAEEVYVEETVLWKTSGESIPVEYWAHPIKQKNNTLGAVITILDITEKRQITQILRTLAQSSSGIIGNRFFKECAKGLGEITKAKLTIIGMVNQNDLATMESMAIWYDGQFMENTTYQIENTPCSTVMGGNPSQFNDNISDQFPNDPFLNKLNLRSYYGVPLISSDKRILGIVAILDTKAMKIDERTSSLLQVFAKRIAMELEQQETTKALREHKKNLELLVHQRTKELEHAFRDLESYSYSIAHDLRSPLRSITSFSQILFEDLQDRLNSTEQDYFRRIINSSQFMAQLIKDILELSRISRSDLNKQNINLSTLVSKIINEKTQNWPEKIFEIIIKENIFTKGDPNLFYILFDNLIENAIKFSQKNNLTYIEFGCEQPSEDRLICYIKDKGVGFNNSYKSKLFKPFERLHSRDEFEGTGIGLATVKRIIERHGGDIWVDGETDRGACFYFTCPDFHTN